MFRKVFFASAFALFLASSSFAGFLDIGSQAAPQPESPQATTTVVEKNGSTLKVTVVSEQKNKGGVTVYENTPNAAEVIRAAKSVDLEALKTEAALYEGTSDAELQREFEGADRKVVEKELARIDARLAMLQVSLDAATSNADKAVIQNLMDSMNRRATYLVNKLGTMKTQTSGEAPTLSEIACFAILSVLAYLFAIRYLLPWLSSLWGWVTSLRITRTGGSGNRRNRNRNRGGDQQQGTHSAPA